VSCEEKIASARANVLVKEEGKGKQPLFIANAMYIQVPFFSLSLSLIHEILSLSLSLARSFTHSLAALGIEIHCMQWKGKWGCKDAI
jgi:hypothetical protein